MSAVVPAADHLTGDLLDRALVLLNTDPHLDRWRSARICLRETPGPDLWLVVDRGTVRRAGDGRDGADLKQIRIAGTAAEWKPILDGLHGGLHRAWRYHLLRFEGDPVALLDLWKTIWRLGDALADAYRRG
ncbi:hypothetical protein [Actinomadura decatromicini]|uniref:SCP2 domain-containing protein n=1 Tax=Actinomadura decatromicini TaxID=2604572 RepID=A0A5D3F207_9ACTN|nr:hypothetical protein [Actinomadura decatromicini]TYK43087.1 hypothetical protein FXF68_40115 [Actinomadura decatromicini]